jgi:small subunit ribosomal protein S7
MPRRRDIKKRVIIKDPIYGSEVITEFISRMMHRGKRNNSAQIIYGAMELLKEKTKKDPLETFLKAVNNVKPLVEVKSRRVGGSTYQVPVEIKPERQEALAMRWIIGYARDRKGKSMSQRLCEELLDASNNQGASIKKKEDTHKMAEANKAFAHYRW